MGASETRNVEDEGVVDGLHFNYLCKRKSSESQELRYCVGVDEQRRLRPISV